MNETSTMYRIFEESFKAHHEQLKILTNMRKEFWKQSQMTAVFFKPDFIFLALHLVVAFYDIQMFICLSV